MKIKLTASETKTISISYWDLGWSQQAWSELTEDEQMAEIRMYVDEIEQPYWDFDIL
jgi:hypothetical protein